MLHVLYVDVQPLVQSSNSSQGMSDCGFALGDLHDKTVPLQEGNQISHLFK